MKEFIIACASLVGGSLVVLLLIKVAVRIERYMWCRQSLKEAMKNPVWQEAYFVHYLRICEEKGWTVAPYKVWLRKKLRG